LESANAVGRASAGDREWMPRRACSDRPLESPLANAPGVGDRFRDPSGGRCCGGC